MCKNQRCHQLCEALRMFASCGFLCHLCWWDRDEPLHHFEDQLIVTTVIVYHNKYQPGRAELRRSGGDSQLPKDGMSHARWPFDGSLMITQVFVVDTVSSRVCQMPNSPQSPF